MAPRPGSGAQLTLPQTRKALVLSIQRLSLQATADTGGGADMVASLPGGGRPPGHGGICGGPLAAIAGTEACRLVVHWYCRRAFRIHPLRNASALCLYSHALRG